MPRLVDPGDVVLWGWGCEAKPTVAITIEPIGGGSWVRITTTGLYYQPPEQRGERSAVLALDETETASTISALLAPEPAEAGGSRLDDTSMADSVGCIHATLPLDTGVTKLWIRETSPHRLIALADLLLGLTERAGLEVGEAFHPVARTYR